MKHAPKKVFESSELTGCSGSNSSGAPGTTALPAASLHWKKKAFIWSSFVKKWLFRLL